VQIENSEAGVEITPASRLFFGVTAARGRPFRGRAAWWCIGLRAKSEVWRLTSDIRPCVGWWSPIVSRTSPGHAGS